MQVGKCLALFALALPLVACQQHTRSGEERVAPTPLVEQIDPQSDPVRAVKAHRDLQQATSVDVASLRAEILRLAQDTSADHAQQCLVLPLGQKPCGGPAEYIALSTKGKDERVILQKLSSYNQAVEAENSRKGLMSDCAITEKPKVQLIAGKCELVRVATE